MSQPARGPKKHWQVGVGLGLALGTGILVLALWPAATTAPAAIERPVASIETAAPAVLLATGAEGPAAMVIKAVPSEQHRRAGEVEAAGGQAPTALALMASYADEICACPDMACFEEARDYHHRHVGEARRVHEPKAMGEAFARASACLETLRQDAAGD